MSVTKVTEDLLQSNSIDGDQIVDGAITSVKILNETITQNKLGTDVIKDIVSLDDRIYVKKYTGGTYEIGCSIFFQSGVLRLEPESLKDSPYFTPENNYVDVFPPFGKTIEDLIGFFVNLSAIWVGEVGGNLGNDDSLRCRWDYHNGLSICQKETATRIRLWLQLSVQEAYPGGSDLRPRVRYFSVWK